jgi:glycogen(starch) synthase
MSIIDASLSHTHGKKGQTPGLNGQNGQVPGVNGNGVYHEPVALFPERAVEPVPPPEIPPPPPAPETLRTVAWDIGQHKAGELFQPALNHVNLAMVSPFQGYAHWRILQPWIDQTAWSRGQAWFHCRLILRLYDVSFVEFNGLNAHRIQDVALPAITGNTFFNLPKPGTFQLAEVGFLLRNGEFVPAARSQAVQFARDSVSAHGSHEALLVDENGVEEVGSLWEQEKVLSEKRKPKMKQGLRLAAFSFEAPVCGQQSLVARLTAELAAQQVTLGHQVHVFVPATHRFNSPATIDGVQYQPLKIRHDGAPLERALSFARAAEKVLATLPPFDLLHIHEWMAGMAPWIGTRPTVLSLNSMESVRRNGAAANGLSLEIQRVERELAHSVDCILTPDWMRDRAIGEFGIDGEHVHAFPMEARMPNEWEYGLDFGHVKMSIGFGPLDRLLVYVGPLEYGAGVDLLVEALPTLLNRCGQVRVAFAGSGDMHGHLLHLAHERGIGHAVHVLGHVDRNLVTKLVRSAEALVLPSRYRIPHDDAVVDLARLAGRPVVTTHAGPSYLVRHEENGVVTYDNPNSLVWALERVLRDPEHGRRMGEAGRRRTGPGCIGWSEVARLYLDLAAATFPELAEPKG